MSTTPEMETITDFNPPKNKETVDHPKHYNAGKFECIEVLKDWLSPEMYEGFLIGNIIKYQSRYKHKNGIEDLKKSQWYLKRLNEEYASGYLKLKN